MYTNLWRTFPTYSFCLRASYFKLNHIDRGIALPLIRTRSQQVIHFRTVSTKPQQQESDTDHQSKTKNASPSRRRIPQLTEEQLQWKPIYRFRYIVIARAIQRLKIMQTGLTCLVVFPFSLWSWYSDPVLHSTTAIAGFSISALACAMLFIMGTLSSKLVGAIYVNKDSSKQNEILLSKLSFTGSRIDLKIPWQSFIPISDLPASRKDLFLKLQLINNIDKAKTNKQNNLLILKSVPSNLYLTLRFGIVLDLKEFETIFGDVSEFNQ